MSTTAAQAQYVTQDSTQVLQRIFTGHLVGEPAMGYAPLAAKVVAALTLNGADAVTVTVTGFTATSGKPVPTFTCWYEPLAGGSTPAKGTPCFVAFPSNEPQGVGVVIAFTGASAPASGGAIIGSSGGHP